MIKCVPFVHRYLTIVYLHTQEQLIRLSVFCSFDGVGFDYFDRVTVFLYCGAFIVSTIVDIPHD